VSVLVVGIDGATFAVLDPLMAEGILPNLSQLTGNGVRAKLSSTPHPLTPAAWTTIATGRSPGNHGVFDFVRVTRREDTLDYSLAGSNDVACETIWSIASRYGFRTAVLNFPCTFPTPPVDGFVVPGFVPWNYMPRAVHPRSLWPRLKALPSFDAKQLAMDWALERTALQGLPEAEIEGWIAFHGARERQWFEIAACLLREERPDLTAVVLDVDKVQHVCYHLLDPVHEDVRTGPLAETLRERCLEYFRQLDRFVGELVALAGSDSHVFVVSDHGFRLAGDRIFYANVWLEQEGYLRWADGVPLDEQRRLTLDGHTETTMLFDWSRTQACALTASGNGVFLRPGLPNRLAVRETLIRSLLSVRDPETGSRVVERVLLPEEVFRGDRTADAPDLTLVLADRSFLSVLRADAPLKSRRAPYGTHHPDGVLVAAGPGIRRGEQLAPLAIVAVAPTILYALGVPVPADFESEPIVAAFRPGHFSANPVRVGPSTIVPGDEEGHGSELDAAAEAAVFERLRALGYVE
jgi:predicted AlkP superfamily phosphohydrolase/phosphomutase